MVRSRQKRSDARPTSGRVIPWSANSTANATLAYVCVVPTYSTRNVGKNDWIAWMTNTPRNASVVVNPMLGRTRSATFDRTLNWSVMFRSGCSESDDRMRDAYRAATGNATTAPSVMATRQSNCVATNTAATGVRRPAGRAHVVEPERLSDVLEPIGEQRGGSREVKARADAEEDAEQCERGERGRGRQQCRLPTPVSSNEATMIVRSPYFSPRIPLGNCMTAYAAHIPVSTGADGALRDVEGEHDVGDERTDDGRATYVPKNAVIVSPEQRALVGPGHAHPSHLRAVSAPSPLQVEGTGRRW